MFFVPGSFLLVKALLEYERHKLQNGELELALAVIPEPVTVENEVSLYFSFLSALVGSSHIFLHFFFDVIMCS